MTFSMNGYEEWKEKNRNEKAEISKMDLIEACGRVAAAAAMPKDAGVGVVAASREIAKIIREFFPEKKEEEKEDKEAEEPQEEKNTEKDAKFEDLKNLLFNHAASYKYPIAATVENLRTTEIRSDAKHAALISLILNAGLGGEYREWLRKKYE